MKSCTNVENALFLSLISLWEIQIKGQLGKLEMSVPWQTMVQRQREDNELQILTLSEHHIEQLASLGTYHRDPFDRMLIAQAQVENMALVSADSALQKYAVDIIQ